MPSKKVTVDTPSSSLYDFFGLFYNNDARRSNECNLSSGTINPETNECELCLNPNNCNCIIDTQTFDTSCDDFCIGDDYDYCGRIFCSADVGGTSSCEGSDISASDDNGGGGERTMISISISCDMTRVCTCFAKFGGGECAACDGAGDGIDCSNVRVVGDDGDDISGPCINAGSCKDTSTTPPPSPEPGEGLPRSYRTDATFLDEVQRMTLPEASKLAGVPMGAAVPDNAKGRSWSLETQKEHVPSHYNVIVVENGMKHSNLLEDESILGIYNFTNADAIIDHARLVGADVRGHVLIWGRGRGTTYPEALAVQVEQSGGRGSMVNLFVYKCMRAASTPPINQPSQPSIPTKYTTSSYPSYYAILSLLASTSSITSKASNSLPNLHGPVRKRTMHAIYILPSYMQQYI